MTEKIKWEYHFFFASQMANLAFVQGQLDNVSKAEGDLPYSTLVCTSVANGSMWWSLLFIVAGWEAVQSSHEFYAVRRNTSGKNTRLSTRASFIFNTGWLIINQPKKCDQSRSVFETTFTRFISKGWQCSDWDVVEASQHICHSKQVSSDPLLREWKQSVIWPVNLCSVQ